MAKSPEFYETIIDGLSHLYDSPFARDVLRAVEGSPGFDLAYALNKNQIRSKKWIVDTLGEVVPGPLGTVFVLGGWFGVLGALLLDDPRLAPHRVVSIDIDPACKGMAERLNRRHLADHRFAAMEADIYRLDVARLMATEGRANGAEDLLVCTSCEHLETFPEWFRDVPDGTLVLLQSNDYFDCEEHVNCVPDLAAFKAQAPMTELLYEGALPLKRYTRFMLIGRK